MPLHVPMDAQGPDSAMADGCKKDKCPAPRDAIGLRGGGAGPAQPPSRGDGAAPPRTRDDGREGGSSPRSRGGGQGASVADPTATPGAFPPPAPVKKNYAGAKADGRDAKCSLLPSTGLDPPIQYNHLGV